MLLMLQMRRLSPFIIVVLVLLSTSARAEPLTETQKIEALIQHVNDLKDATFIRNGKEHTPPDAAKHMRDKWQWKKSEIKTAADFITIAASKSSMSGKPYLIRFKGGKEVQSAMYLRAQLKKLEEPEKDV
jgi:hypothetical protein